LRIGEKYNFHRENFHRLLAFAAPKNATPSTFAEKNFVNSHKPAKFTKVSRYTVYGTYVQSCYLPSTKPTFSDEQITPQAIITFIKIYFYYVFKRINLHNS